MHNICDTTAAVPIDLELNSSAEAGGFSITVHQAARLFKRLEGLSSPEPLQRTVSRRA
jgi:hypothetical protein